MRLLDTGTGQFAEKDPTETDYAILSHTWNQEEGEQAYEELRNIRRRYPTAPHSDWHGDYDGVLPLVLPPTNPPERASIAPETPRTSSFVASLAHATLSPFT